MSERETSISGAEEKISEFTAERVKLESEIKDHADTSSQDKEKIQSLELDLENVKTLLKKETENLKKSHQEALTAVENSSNKLKSQLDAEAVAREEIFKENSRLKTVIKNLENQIDTLRESVLQVSQESSKETDNIKNQLISENKSSREEIEVLRGQLEAAKSELEVTRGQLATTRGELESQISRLTSESNQKSEKENSLTSEIEKLRSEIQNLRNQIRSEEIRQAEALSETKSGENSMREQMAKMQERLNVADLERTTANQELANLLTNQELVESEMTKLTGAYKISLADSEKLKAELEQEKIEHSKTLQKLDEANENIKKVGEKSEKIEVSLSENIENSDVVLGMRQELSILREKNHILEEKYRLNRRISPRTIIKAGKTVDPPPMAPSSDYVSTDDGENVDSKRLKGITKSKYL